MKALLNMTTSNDNTSACIARIISGRQRRTIADAGLRPAAVLVPVFVRDGERYFLMGVRSPELEHHQGQIAFPGGLLEDGDSGAEDCALREAAEEIGLRRADVEVLGLLDDERTITGFRITPVVGRVPYPYRFRLNRREMTRLLEVPWALFADPDRHRRESITIGEVEHQVDFYQFGEHTIWGATARISRRLIELVSPSSTGKEGAA